MSNPSSSSPSQDSPLVTGAWTVVGFVGACSIAAGHTTLGGIFPFVALAAAVTLVFSISNLARR